MATIDLTNGAAPRQNLAGNVVSVSVLVDAAVNNLATSNVYKIAPLAPYSIVHSLFCTIVTAEGGVCTMDLGVMGDDITDDPNGFDDAVNANAAAGTITYSTLGTDAALGLNIGASGGYITVAVDNAADAVKFRIDAIVSHSQNA